MLPILFIRIIPNSYYWALLSTEYYTAIFYVKFLGIWVEYLLQVNSYNLIFNPIILFSKPYNFIFWAFANSVCCFLDFYRFSSDSISFISKSAIVSSKTVYEAWYVLYYSTIESFCYWNYNNYSKLYYRRSSFLFSISRKN